jgi:hypothetical protein
MVCHLVRPDLAGDPRILQRPWPRKRASPIATAGPVKLRGEKIGDGMVDLWFRSTWCLGRIEGGWRITHEHNSTPFSMDASLRAATDLVP